MMRTELSSAGRSIAATIIAVLVLVLFGAKKLPTFARSLGRSMGEFRKAKDEFEAELHRSVDEVEKPTIKAPEEKRQPVSYDS